MLGKDLAKSLASDTVSKLDLQFDLRDGAVQA